MNLKTMLREMTKEVLNRTLIAQRIKSLRLKGFGGECGMAAVKINNQVFGGKAKLVGAANSFHLDRGNFFGHIAVEYSGVYWDADGIPKNWSDIESWGMLDVNDPDYFPEDDFSGWDEEAANDVEKVVFDNAEEVLKYMPSCETRNSFFK